METCPVCKNTLRPSFHKDGFLIGECDECGILAVMNSVTQSDLKSIYSDDYYRRDLSRYTEVSRKEREVWLRRLRMIEKMQVNSAAGRMLLDVGCGTGVFLAVAQEKGWDVSGVEISTDAAALTKKKVGTARISQDFLMLENTEGFDVITIWAVIEHLIDPLGYLEKAYSLLNPGGILALATVSTDAWNRKFFGDSWRYFTPPEHLVYFNENNLRRSLMQTGFRPVSLATYFNEYAFWQSFPFSRLENRSLTTRLIRKVFVTPLRIAANLFQAGDIVEVFAERV